MPQPDCTAEELDFGRIGRRVVGANFEGGAISSDGGLMLLQQVDKHSGLTQAAAAAIHDPRDPDYITHSMQSLVAQRIYGIACGYEDLNDHNSLRQDPLFQTSLNRIEDLASSPTLCRLEGRAIREDILQLNKVLLDQFIAQHKQAPERLVLDFDASDVPLHGNQEGIEFHGYYDQYCYLPLYVYCGKAMLCCILRRSRIDGAKQAAAVLKLLVKYLRQHWPEVEIVFRADSGFCRKLIINWCERNQVRYVVGLARNQRLQARVRKWENRLASRFVKAQTKQRSIHEFRYAAKSWPHKRRVITRLEYGAKGRNPRFIVTNMAEAATELYDDIYCARGEAENRIKETQLDLFGTRASCSAFLSNWMRLMFSALAYTLMQQLKQWALQGTELAQATSATIRSRLLKIGAVVTRNTRRIRIMFSSHHPLRTLFWSASRKLALL